MNGNRIDDMEVKIELLESRIHDLENGIDDALDKMSDLNIDKVNEVLEWKEDIDNGWIQF